MEIFVSEDLGNVLEQHAVNFISCLSGELSQKVENVLCSLVKLVGYFIRKLRREVSDPLRNVKFVAVKGLKKLVQGYFPVDTAV